MIRIGLNENPVTPWDSVLLAHYQEKDEFFWLNDSLISDKPAAQVADSMLFWLGNISQHGVNPNLYPVDSIREELQQIRTFEAVRREDDEPSAGRRGVSVDSRLSLVCVSIEIWIPAFGAQME